MLLIRGFGRCNKKVGHSFFGSTALWGAKQGNHLKFKKNQIFLAAFKHTTRLPIQILAWHDKRAGPKGGGQALNGGKKHVICDKILRKLLQGYKHLIRRYIWVNQQHSGANWSRKPLNMDIFWGYFPIIKELCVKWTKHFWSGGDLTVHWGGLKLFWMGGQALMGRTACAWGIVPPPHPPHVGQPCTLPN